MKTFSYLLHFLLLSVSYPYARKNVLPFQDTVCTRLLTIRHTYSFFRSITHGFCHFSIYLLYTSSKVGANILIIFTLYKFSSKRFTLLPDKQQKSDKNNTNRPISISNISTMIPAMHHFLHEYLPLCASNPCKVAHECDCVQ